MPYCLRGEERTGRNATKPAFHYYDTDIPPRSTYRSNEYDVAYWGMTFDHIGFSPGANVGPAMASYVITFVSGPGQCNSPEINPSYDCINGVCVNSYTYNTNGIFSTLELCQASCGGSGGTGCAAPNICVPPDYCPPGMVCLPDGEFSQIEGLGVALNNGACS